MIDERDQQGISLGAYLLDAARDRDAHFAGRIIIECKGGIRILQMLTHFISAMTNDDNNFIYGCVAKIVDAPFNDSGISEGEQRLKFPHAPRLAGRENDGSNFGFHRSASSARIVY